MSEYENEEDIYPEQRKPIPANLSDEETDSYLERLSDEHAGQLHQLLDSIDILVNSGSIKRHI